LHRGLGHFPMRIFAPIAVAGGILFAPAVFAATVSVIPADGTSKGTVFLNRGNGFLPILSTTEARSGDSVMALKMGIAAIVYPDGCRVEVSARTAVVVVQETSPCKAPSPPETTGALGVGRYIVGAALVGGAVTAAVLIGDGNGSDDESKAKHRERSGDPASP
jgi:hypothetical protein